MEKKKLTLEDLKLESFLTELNDARLVKVQGGAGAYGETDGCDDETTTDDTIPDTATEVGGGCPEDWSIGCVSNDCSEGPDCDAETGDIACPDGRR